MAKSKSDGSSGLGKALMKERRKKGKMSDKDGWLHTSELSDGYEWGRLNLASVTEENSLDEFLRTAELAGTEFTAEKRNISVVLDTERHTGLPGADERREIELAQESNRQDLCIPRRPSWDESTTAEQLELKERESFLEWRRHLASLEKREKILLTPFERNLEFWRQLWRVIERSDVVVQIVDARNPLLFHCKDLDKYVREINPEKVNMLLMNKSDLLTAEQRREWLKYFQSQEEFENVCFWSAKETLEEDEDSEATDTTGEATGTTGEATGTTGEATGTTGEATGTTGEATGTTSEATGTTSEATGTTGEATGTTSEATGTTGEATGTTGEATGEAASSGEGIKELKDQTASSKFLCSEKLVSRKELLEIFRKLAPITKSPAVIGLVGYPNVGKSSTINCLLQMKKVPVSATPGRTKHFQTLHVSKDLVLCDCPGLVFPNFINTKADMICNGILPIDQMRDHVPPVSMVCQKVPRPVLVKTYGIQLPRPLEGEDPFRSPLAHELLCAYGYSRGFMTAHGQPDQSRSARYILKDFVNGKLLYCEPPPLMDPVKFNRTQELEQFERIEELEQTELFTDTPKFDERFFVQREGTVHCKGAAAGLTGKAGFTGEMGGAKPWKKHHNYKKKEKTRRIVGDPPI